MGRVGSVVVGMKKVGRYGEEGWQAGIGQAEQVAARRLMRAQNHAERMHASRAGGE